ncbi:MAG: helix-turn-helix domain-containing protein, partial [Gemmatimonadales bacterium]
SNGGKASILPTLGGRVADLRENRGLKQQELAKAAGISVTFLSEVENGHRKPGTDALLGLADALDTTLDYLVKGELPPAPKREPVVIPPELVAFVEEENLSWLEARQLLSAQRMVVARRSGSTAGGENERPLSKEQWRRLHEWLRKLPR